MIDGLQALAEGMANCFKLEYLIISCNSFTAVGLRALSAFIRSKKFCLQSLDMRFMDIDGGGMMALVAGLARLQSLKSLDLSYNVVGDECLQYVRAGLANSCNLEKLVSFRIMGRFQQ